MRCLSGKGLRFLWGGSVSGARTGWKLLKLREITSLHMGDKGFTPRLVYKRNDKDMMAIFVQV